MDIDAFVAITAADLGVLVQALVAIILGGVVGLEREAAGKLAGFRTNILVCLASFLFTRIGILVTETASVTLDAGLVEADPIRIVQAIVVGISFLGTGVIIREPQEDRVHGLTTAATLLVVAPVGVAVAMHHYVLAVGVTVLTLIVLRAFNRLEDRLTGDR
jgi:putative Mg2+ transporter-C (MgtC) family protein